MNIMQNKKFRIIALIGIIGNILVGISYLVINNYASAIIHIASGIIFIPMYLESKGYID
jgi:hypothetical protein